MKRFIGLNTRAITLNININHCISYYRPIKRFCTTDQLNNNDDRPMSFAQRYANRDSNGKVKLIIGDYSSYEKTFSAEDVDTYSKITGDNNPMHNINDSTMAKYFGFDDSLVHGMFTGALFSAAVGAHFPGSVLVEKTLKWKKPLYIGEHLKADVVVSKILQRKKIVFCDLMAKNGNDEVCIEGNVVILVRDLE